MSQFYKFCTKWVVLLIPDDCQPQKAEDSDTSDIQAAGRTISALF